MDVLNLTPTNIVTGIDGEKWIAKNRTNTDTPEHIPLLPIAVEISDQYKKTPSFNACSVSSVPASFFARCWR